MPPRQRKPCTCPGCPACNRRCPAIVASGRCAQCAPHAPPPPPHDADRKRIYNSKRWKALRRQVATETGFCAIGGCLEPWTHLDHEPPLRDVLAAGGDPYARSGVQPLCHSHHSAKTRREMRNRRSDDGPRGS